MLSPNRVVINESGEAKPPGFGVSRKHRYDMIFIRNDGWMLGAQHIHEEVAFNLWADEWFAFYEMRTHKILPISVYIERQKQP